MRYGIPLTCLFSASVLLTACQTPSSFMPNGLMPLTNGQIVKDITVADRGEVSTAKVAKNRAQRKDVRSYATYLYNEHARCEHKIANLAKKEHIKPENSTYAQEIQKYYADERQSLEATSRQDFDKTYVNTVIKDHQQALNFLDRSIRDSTNLVLTEDLKKARTHIATHLVRAQQLKQKYGF